MSSRIKELDALRGIAALLVLLFHFTNGRIQSSLGFKFGITGVDLFFMISGFVIFMSISKVKSGTEFLINRFTRLYPTYWASVTFTFVLMLVIGHASINSLPTYFINLSMFQYFLHVPDIDGPYWTLAVELQFYILMFFLFYFRKLNGVVWTGCISSALLLIYDILFERFFPEITSVLDKVFPLLNHFPLFFAGILFYKMYDGRNKINEIVLSGFMLLFCFILQLLRFENGGRTHYFMSHVQYGIILIIYFAFFTLFVSGKLTWIVSKPTLFLGKISFALYLLHQYIGKQIITGLMESYDFSFWLSASIAFTLLVLLSAAITFSIEIPFGKKLNSFLRKYFGISPRTG